MHMAGHVLNCLSIETLSSKNLIAIVTFGAKDASNNVAKTSRVLME